MSNKKTVIPHAIVLRPQTVVPTEPTDGLVYFDKARKSARYFFEGKFIDFGAGGGSGEINFLNDVSAESGLSGWIGYDDGASNVPVDGDGGTPTGLALATTTVAPIYGDASYVLTQTDATDVQGKGYSKLFKIPEGFKGKRVYIGALYQASSTFFAADSYTLPEYDGTTAENAGNSDIQFFIINDDTSELIIPDRPSLTQREGVASFFATFTTNQFSTNYRLVMHCARDSAETPGWSLKFDLLHVSPLTNVVAERAVSLTLQGASQVFASSEQVLKYTTVTTKRGIDYDPLTGLVTILTSGTYEVSGTFTTTADPTNPQLFFRKFGFATLFQPPIGNAINGVYNVLPRGTFEAGAGDQYYLGFFSSAGGTQSANPEESVFSINMVGSTGVALSADESYVMQGSIGSGPSLGNGAQATIAFQLSGAGALNNLGWYDTTTGILKARRACRLLVSATVLWNANNVGVRQLIIDRTGVALYVDFKQAESTVETANHLTRLVDMIAGDTLEIQLLQNSGGTISLYPSGIYNQLNIVEVPQLTLTGNSGAGTFIGQEVTGQITEAQLQAQMGPGWILEDGRDVTGSRYHQMTGNTTVPDARATVLRGKDNGRGLNPDGDLALGTYQTDQIGPHSHALRQGNGAVDSVVESWLIGNNGAFDPSGDAGAFMGGNTSTAGGNETRGKSTTTNIFIRIN